MSRRSSPVGPRLVAPQRDAPAAKPVAEKAPDLLARTVSIERLASVDTPPARSDGRLRTVGEMLRQHGYVHPLLAHANEPGIDGVTRYTVDIGRWCLWAAQRLLELESDLTAEERGRLVNVPIVVHHDIAVTDPILRLITVLDRERLDILTEARALSELKQITGWSNKTIGAYIGRSEGHVHGRLQILLRSGVVDAVERGLKASVAVAIAALPDEETRERRLQDWAGGQRLRARDIYAAKGNESSNVDDRTATSGSDAPYGPPTRGDSAAVVDVAEACARWLLETRLLLEHLRGRATDHGWALVEEGRGLLDQALSLAGHDTIAVPVGEVQRP